MTGREHLRFDTREGSTAASSGARARIRELQRLLHRAVDRPYDRGATSTVANTPHLTCPSQSHSSVASLHRRIHPLRGRADLVGLPPFAYRPPRWSRAAAGTGRDHETEKRLSTQFSDDEPTATHSNCPSDNGRRRECGQHDDRTTIPLAVRGCLFGIARHKLTHRILLRVTEDYQIDIGHRLTSKPYREFMTKFDQIVYRTRPIRG